MTHTRPVDAPDAGHLVCTAALSALVEQVGSVAATAFVERFVRLWPIRQHRLHVAVAGRDAEAGRDAALSLASGASMAGAHRLAELGARLHADVPESVAGSAWSDAERTLADIDRLGGESIADVARLAHWLCPGAV